MGTGGASAVEHFSAFPTWCQHLSARGLWLVLFACGFTLAVTRDQRVGWEPSPKKSVFFHLLRDRGQEERRAAHWEGRGGDRVPTLFKKSQFSASALCRVPVLCGDCSQKGTVAVGCSGCAVGHSEPGRAVTSFQRLSPGDVASAL